MPSHPPAKQILDCSNATLMLLDEHQYINYISPTLTQQLGQHKPDLDQPIANVGSELVHLPLSTPVKIEINQQTYMVSSVLSGSFTVLNWHNISAPLTLSQALHTQLQQFEDGQFDTAFEPPSSNPAVQKMSQLINPLRWAVRSPITAYSRAVVS
mgnify:CR=1 FL=1